MQGLRGGRRAGRRGFCSQQLSVGHSMAGRQGKAGYVRAVLLRAESRVSCAWKAGSESSGQVGREKRKGGFAFSSGWHEVGGVVGSG
jgi:hypothetical protein